MYRGKWTNGPRYVHNNRRYYYDGFYVALKKIENSQNNSDEFLKEVNVLI